MSRSLPPIVVQIIGALGFLAGLYLALRGKPGGTQAMLLGAGLLGGVDVVKRLAREGYEAPRDEDLDRLDEYRKRRLESRGESHERRRESREDPHEWDDDG